MIKSVEENVEKLRGENAKDDDDVLENSLEDIKHKTLIPPSNSIFSYLFKKFKTYFYTKPYMWKFTAALL